MNISRGFRRLSALAGFVGLAVLAFLLGGLDSKATLPQVIFGVLLLGGVPALVVLLLGWIILGLRKLKIDH